MKLNHTSADPMGAPWATSTSVCLWATACASARPGAALTQAWPRRTRPDASARPPVRSSGPDTDGPSGDSPAPREIDARQRTERASRRSSAASCP